MQQKNPGAVVHGRCNPVAYISKKAQSCMAVGLGKILIVKFLTVVVYCILFYCILFWPNMTKLGNLMCKAFQLKHVWLAGTIIKSAVRNLSI